MKQINETKIRVKRLIFNYTFTDDICTIFSSKPKKIFIYRERMKRK